MAPQPTTALAVVLGCMTIGDAAHSQSRIKSEEEEKAFLDAFASHGHTMLDTAIMYSSGSCEKHLGSLDLPSRGLVVATKIYPTASAFPGAPVPQYSHTRECIRATLAESLSSLQTPSVDLYYLHAPDRNTPFLDSLRAITELHQEGRFARFGVSNYTAADMREMLALCEQHNLLKPTVYQGMYNALHRAVELELLPLLREHGIAFYAYNPLAGGYLTDRYQRDTKLEGLERGSRFDPSTFQGKGYIARYWNDAMFDALELLRPVAKKFGLGEAECALRWMMHHGLLEAKFGDAVVVGASSVAQLEGNLTLMEKGPLPEEVLRVLDQGWQRTKDVNVKYWH
ncbi:uncharacterized protein HMPREF1541_07638 [Cyphellophora europaea CBS 101466]|uniref:NADP-dependent oxidoreductase domain-containing protein n=1 Tax=Cyphellophora europaea (strain CBS 101466) TaxID=1220924 RepID=W2RNW2_CYPE1|nr:uncharacterized protein HMPREF1541_07638 [Cyphellophora europaea CBS 101466]ETN38015.1 hypothetical protein HMPREF1541_07638 [Cyphellophora europaea CBS 101466]